MMDNKNEYIICAAIYYQDGKVYEHQPKNISNGYVLCGRRHHNIITANFLLTGSPTRKENTQGFLTSKDRFLNRSDSMKIAIKAGQVQKDETNIGYDLISEDLY